ncbi:MAG: amidohydrolase, partial [Dehalococcoidia bacterium]|nr:amidohydrolase [Dehalococcoidia bacterium]
HSRSSRHFHFLGFSYTPMCPIIADGLHILHSGQVIPAADHNIREAVAIKGEVIQAVGSNRDVLALAGPSTTTVNLRGRTVIPGIIDAHAHMDREGLKHVCPSLQGAASIADILAIVEQQVAQKRAGEWGVTMPVGDPPNYTDVPGCLREGRYPTRWELDRVSPHNPVYIRGIWTPWNVPPSVAVANSMALQMAGIDRQTPAPDSSVTIDRDNSGEITGILIDRGRAPSLEFTLMKAVPRFTHAQRVEALKESMRLYNSVGTTGAYEGHGVAPEVLRAYKELWDRGEMTVRAQLVLSPAWKSVGEAAHDMQRWAHAASGSGFGDSMLRISGCYIEYRGDRYSARARCAELPFTGWAGFAQGYNPPGRYRRLVSLAAQHNLRVNTIVRDTLDEVLQVFEDVHRETPIDGQRWVLTHVQETTPEQLRLVRDLGLVIESIPLTDLWLRGRRYVDDPGGADRADAHRSYLEQGADFCFGSDNKPYNPFATFWSAVTRRERLTDKTIGPAQCLTRLEALKAFTIGGAYCCFEEDRRGALEPGKLADLAVLSGDLLTIPEEELPGLYSVLTMVGGDLVHSTEDL